MDATIVAWGLAVGLIHFGLLISNPQTSELDKMVNCEDIDDKGSAVLGITFHIALVFGCIFINWYLMLSQERLAATRDPGANETLTLSRICKTTGLVLLYVHYVGMLLGYPDMEMKTCAFMAHYVGLLIFLILAIVMIECIYQVEEDDEEEQRIMEEGAIEL